MFQKTLFGSVVAVAVLALAGGAYAQSFNVDLDTTAGGPGAGPPAVGYLAAAVGPVDPCWNALTGATATTIPNLIAGPSCTPTAVSFTRSTAAGGAFAFNNAGTTGDFERLMDDGQDLSASTGNVTYTFGPLQGGTYTVYTYAWAPDVPGADFTIVNVVGSLEGPQVVGGNLPGSNQFGPGITHAIHTVVVPAGGNIQVQADGQPGSFGTLNGIQIVIPEPATLSLLAFGALALIRRR